MDEHEESSSVDVPGPIYTVVIERQQRREAEDDQDDVSDESSAEVEPTGEHHSAILRIDLGSDEKAQIICRILAVDKEPSRSTAKRTYSTQGHHLVVEIISSDAKYLQKSIDNLFDMCYLAKQTIEQVTEYRLKMPSDAVGTTANRSRKTKRKMNGVLS